MSIYLPLKSQNKQSMKRNKTWTTLGPTYYCFAVSFSNPSICRFQPLCADLRIPSHLLIAVFFSIAGNNEQLNNWSWFLQRSCKTKPLGGAEMKKGGAIYDQIMQTEPSRKMPPPFYGPQQNNLQETIYYQHGFPLVSTKT